MNTNFSDISKYIPRIYRGIRIYYDCSLAKYNIGWSQQFLLEHIYEHPGVKPQELTDTYRIEKYATTRGLKKLFDGGYITVETDLTDHRAKCLYATETADEVIQTIRSLRERLDQVFMADISGQDLMQCEAVLRKLHDNLAEEVKRAREGSIHE